jgi:Fe-S cluster biogenesis protein NfuA
MVLESRQLQKVHFDCLVGLLGCTENVHPARIFQGGHADMQEKVQAVIDKIRPTLQADGGDVELVSVEDGVVKVRLQGACKGCPMSQMTLKNGIEKFLQKEIPEVVRVEGVD